MASELVRWHDYGIGVVCAKTAEEAREFANDLVRSLKPYISGGERDGNFPSPEQVLLRAQLLQGGIMPVLFHSLLYEHPSVADFPHLNTIAESSHIVFEVFGEVLRKLGYSAKQIAEVFRRFRFKIKDLITGDYFRDHKYFKYAFHQSSKVEVPAHYRARILTRATQLVRDFLDYFLAVVRVLQRQDASDDFGEIKLTDHARKTVIYCDRIKGELLLSDETGESNRLLKISPRAKVVWRVIRKLGEAVNGEAELTLAEINAFRRTDANNDTIRGDLDILLGHIVPGTRPNCYQFSPIAKKRLRRLGV